MHAYSIFILQTPSQMPFLSSLISLIQPNAKTILTLHITHPLLPPIPNSARRLYLARLRNPHFGHAFTGDYSPNSPVINHLQYINKPEKENEEGKLESTNPIDSIALLQVRRSHKSEDTEEESNEESCKHSNKESYSLTITYSIIPLQFSLTHVTYTSHLSSFHFTDHMFM